MDVLRIFTLLVAFNSNFAFFGGFIKIHEYFPINPTLFLKSSNFEHFEKSYFLRCIREKISNFWLFYKNPRFCLKNPSECFFKKTQFLNVFRILSFPPQITPNLLHLGVLKKDQDFFRKTYLFSKMNPKFWTFWEISLFQSHSTTNLILWEIFIYWRLFLKESVFYLGKPQFLNILRNLTILKAFYGKIHDFGNFEKFKTFFEKHLFFLRKPNFWTFWQFSRFQSHSTATLKVLELLKISRLYRKIRIFFRKTQTSNILRIITFSVAFHRKSPNFSDFKKFREFFFG